MKNSLFFKIYIVLIIIVSLAFIGFNILAQVETETDLKQYIKEGACPNFVDLTELTMKDECTGLVWARNELPTYHGADKPGYAWQQAADSCDNFVEPGLFRLPTVEELLSLVKYQCDQTGCEAGLKRDINGDGQADFAPPFFSNGIYWSINDFNESPAWTDPSAIPSPGHEDRDYKRSVNLLNGEVDSPVFSKKMRLNAWCIMDRDPEIIERKFTDVSTASIPHGTAATGGQLKTVYNRQCNTNDDCSALTGTVCDNGFCADTPTTNNIDLNDNPVPVSCDPDYHLEYVAEEDALQCVSNPNTSTEDCPSPEIAAQGIEAYEAWKGNSFNGYRICRIETCSSYCSGGENNGLACDEANGDADCPGGICMTYHVDPDTELCVANRRDCLLPSDRDANGWTERAVQDWDTDRENDWGPCYALECSYAAEPVDDPNTAEFDPVCQCDETVNTIREGICSGCADDEHYENGVCVSDCLKGSFSLADCLDGGCDFGININQACTDTNDCPVCESDAQFCQNNETNQITDISCTADSECVNECNSNICTISGDDCDVENPCPAVDSSCVVAGDCSNQFCKIDTNNIITDISCSADNDCLNECSNNTCTISGDTCSDDNPCPTTSCQVIDNRKQVWQGGLFEGFYDCIFQGCDLTYTHESLTEIGTCESNSLNCLVNDVYGWVLSAIKNWDETNETWEVCNATNCVPQSILSTPDPDCNGLDQEACSNQQTCSWNEQAGQCQAPVMCVCENNGIYEGDPIIRDGQCDYCGNGITDGVCYDDNNDDITDTLNTSNCETDCGDDDICQGGCKRKVCEDLDYTWDGEACDSGIFNIIDTGVDCLNDEECLDITEVQETTTACDIDSDCSTISDDAYCEESICKLEVPKYSDPYCEEGTCKVRETKYVLPLSERKADVVFIFDTSGSMSDEQATICSEYNSVITTLLGQDYYTEIAYDMFSLPPEFSDYSVFPSCQTGLLGTRNKASSRYIEPPQVSCDIVDDCYSIYEEDSGVNCTSNICTLNNDCNEDADCVAKYKRYTYCGEITSGQCALENAAYYPNCDFYEEAEDCNYVYNCITEKPQSCTGDDGCSDLLEKSSCLDPADSLSCSWTPANCIDDPEVSGNSPRTIDGTDYQTWEDWGEGIIDVINNRKNRAWLEGNVKLIIPVSDEAPQNGSKRDPTGSLSGGPNGYWQKEDYDILQQISSLAQAEGVIISPIYTNDSYSTQTVTVDGTDYNVSDLLNDLAKETGGTAILGTLTNADEKIKSLITGAGALCDDFTGDKLMDCEFTPVE